MNRFHLLPLVACLMWATGASWAQTSPSAANNAAKPAAKPRPAAGRPSDLVTLSFNNAEISEVARAMAMITNRSVVVDPRETLRSGPSDTGRTAIRQRRPFFRCRPVHTRPP